MDGLVHALEFAQREARPRETCGIRVIRVAFPQPGDREADDLFVIELSRPTSVIGVRRASPGSIVRSANGTASTCATDSTHPRSSRFGSSNTCNCVGERPLTPALTFNERCTASASVSPRWRKVPGSRQSPAALSFTSTTDSCPSGGSVSSAVSTATDGRS